MGIILVVVLSLFSAFKAGEATARYQAHVLAVGQTAKLCPGESLPFRGEMRFTAPLAVSGDYVLDPASAKVCGLVTQVAQDPQPPAARFVPRVHD